jgi:hypothetical protein
MSDDGGLGAQGGDRPPDRRLHPQGCSRIRRYHRSRPARDNTPVPADPWTLVVDRAAPAGARVAALRAVADREDGDADRMGRFATAFVGELVATADARRAFDRGAAAATGGERGALRRPRWARPGTDDPTRAAVTTALTASLGLRATRGARDLIAEPSVYRDAIAIVLRALGQLAGDERKLIFWLFEAVKLWTSHERGLALAALREAAPTAAELLQGIAELVMFAAAGGTDGPGQLLRALLVEGKRDARWTFALIHEASQSPAAAAALGEALTGTELGHPLRDAAPRWVESLDAAATAQLTTWAERAPSALRAVTLGLLAAHPPERQHARTGLVTLLADDRVADPVAAACALALLRLRSWDEETHDAARRALRRARNGRARDVLAALVRNCVRASRAADPQVTTATDGRALIAVAHDLVGKPIAHGAAVWFAYRQIAVDAPASARLTDEEELGLLRLTPRSPALVRFPMPVELPMRPGGAHRARRALRIETVVGDAIAMILHSPYRAAGGRGQRHHVLGLSPETGEWTLWRAEGDRLEPAPVIPGRRYRERELPALDAAEVLVWVGDDGALTWAVDDTAEGPRDRDHTGEVEAAFAARARSHARAGQRPVTTSMGDLLEAADWPIEIDGREQVLRGARPFVTGAWAALAELDDPEVRCLGGVCGGGPGGACVVLRLRARCRGAGAVGCDAIAVFPL